MSHLSSGLDSSSFQPNVSTFRGVCSVVSVNKRLRLCHEMDDCKPPTLKMARIITEM